MNIMDELYEQYIKCRERNRGTELCVYVNMVTFNVLMEHIRETTTVNLPENEDFEIFGCKLYKVLNPLHPNIRWTKA